MLELMLSYLVPEWEQIEDVVDAGNYKQFLKKYHQEDVLLAAPPPATQIKREYVDEFAPVKRVKLEVSVTPKEFGQVAPFITPSVSLATTPNKSPLLPTREFGHPRIEEFMLLLGGMLVMTLPLLMLLLHLYGQLLDEVEVPPFTKETGQFLAGESLDLMFNDVVYDEPINI